MGVWGEQVVPRVNDRSLAAAPVMRLRERACAGLAGRVLEIGFGSGLNLAAYPAEVTAVDAVEPSDVAWTLSKRRRAGTPLPVARTGLDGQRLDVPDGSYDAALSTFTLCTIPDATLALREVRRALRPGGTLHFLEHGLAPDPGVATWQRRLDPLQRRMVAGCHLRRDLPALIAAAGLELLEVDADYLAGPRVSRPWGYLYIGRARRPA